ncbi:MAG: ADP-ribosylglycohydrolase family protein [Armatimonadota bacterium]
MATISFEDKIKGAMLGAVIGAELGYTRNADPARFAVASPMDIFNIKLEPILDRVVIPGKKLVMNASTEPFADLVFRAYLRKQGRITPEDLAILFKDDEGLSDPIFFWDPVHTTQEILKEGMNPRISGIGNVPCGYMCAAMPAVGIYHFANPEYAYLDGVELASVTQPRLGADWAGLTAALIAAAFSKDASPQDVIDTVLKIAHENNKDLFYQIDLPFRWGGISAAGEEGFISHWYYNGTESGSRNEKGYWSNNPIAKVLPVLRQFGDKVEKLLIALIAPPQESPCVTALIGGAVMGALYGADVFPVEWRKWAEPMIAKWMPFIDVVQARVEKEQCITSVVDTLSETDENGESVLFDKVYGCILAGAIGNAMGSPVESQNYEEIDAKYPNHVTTILNTAALENEDDNQMAMMLVETYLDREARPVMARHFGKTWIEKMNRDKFFVNCMGHCYDLIRAGWDPRITGHWTQVTGSTVMCMEPVGIYHITDPEYAHIDAKAISYMYQRGLDNVAASLLAGVVAEAFRPGATVESVCTTAIALSPDEPLHTFDKRPFSSVKDYIKTCLDIAEKYDDVLAVRKELYEKCLFYCMIDPLEVIGFSLAIFRVANGDVRQAAIGGTNIGRDSDTISGRAAMLSGILSGGKSVPADWIAMFKPEVLTKIKVNSGRLTDMIIKKNDKMKSRIKNI